MYKKSKIMKRLLSVIAILLCLTVVSAYGQNDKQTNDSTTAAAQSDSAKAPDQAKGPALVSGTIAQPVADSGSSVLLYVALGVSALSLIAAALLFFLLKKQKDALKALEIRCQSKLDSLKEGAITESEVRKIAEAAAKDYSEEVQTQISVRMQAMMMANEAAKASQEKIEQQAPVFKPMTLYASFSPSYCGFRGDEVSPDKTYSVTFRITTTDEKHAEYQLLENVSSSLVDSSQLEALDYSGNAQSYSYIRLVSPGELEYVDGSDYWQIKRKAVISFE